MSAHAPVAPGFRRVRFYGASDDLIEVEGIVTGCDEYSKEKARFAVAGLLVTVEFASTGCWHIDVGQIGEDVEVCATNLHLGPHECGYSMTLWLDIPDGTCVVEVAA